MPFEVQDKDTHTLTLDIFNELSMGNRVEGEMAYQTVGGACTWVLLFKPKHPHFRGLFLTIRHLFEEGTLIRKVCAQQEVTLVRDGDNNVRVDVPALASNMTMRVARGPFAS